MRRVIIRHFTRRQCRPGHSYTYSELIHSHTCPPPSRREAILSSRTRILNRRVPTHIHIHIPRSNYIYRKVLEFSFLLRRCGFLIEYNMYVTLRGRFLVSPTASSSSSSSSGKRGRSTEFSMKNFVLRKPRRDFGYRRSGDDCSGPSRVST